MSDAARPEAPDRIDAPLVRAAFVLVLGTFMATLDATIVAVGVSTLATEFDATPVEIQWVSTAYLLAVVTAVPTSGWLVDRFGGRRTWIVAVLAFVVASALCALAWSLASLVAFRVLQGLAGGLLPPTGQAVLARLAGPSRIGRVISIVAVVPLLSPVLGPLAGGAVLGVASWPWLFYVNLPIGIAAAVLALLLVPADTAAARGAAFDVRGALLLSPGLAVLVLGLTEVERTGGALPGVPISLAGVAMLVLFVVHGLRTRGTPLIDPRLFARSPFGPAALALVILGLSVFGATFLLPLYLQTGRGLDAWETGLLLAPQGVGALAGSLLVNRLVDRISPRNLVLTGIGLVALGTVVFTQLAHDPPDTLVAVSLLVRGAGGALIGAPVMALVYRTMAKEMIPRAASALNLLNTLGGSVGTALVAVILQSRLSVLGQDASAAAFGQTFWWVLGFCLLALAGATRLPGVGPAARPGAGPAR
ncbi:drug resistance transporter, EmrB/QacA subfamily [Pseudonocardia ammonioxydans]|uniref:Drug resistance transporter, EmrB/QacA subfamily n=1 Tax=Pseudonocardia ammonioxydans TaxID=260086 RepID=A0A1I4S985_PSUAM|nr:DHA2 family efflux MFS transporter permease subunit [Pseudonocardia ammonioxydans]SFM60854.1 drug resistance transporter, EmrB/QacA subfamily [Pseudonocardia ammonioxydans]